MLLPIVFSAPAQIRGKTIISIQESANGYRPGHIRTPADLASEHGLKRQVVKGKTEWHGKNPNGHGATDNGFRLREDGTAYDRSQSQNYKTREVAELFGIAPEQYAPEVEYRERNGHSRNGHTNYSANGQHKANGSARAKAPTASTSKPNKPNAGRDHASGQDEPEAPPKTPQERGLSAATLKYFQVRPVNSRKFQGWKYPTFHADGTQGRDRFKNARAKSKTEQKYQWWKGGDGREPAAYNIHSIPSGAPEVWAVGGEPDVWMMHQAGLLAIAPFGETQGAADLVAAVKALGVGILPIALDNDGAGHTGAVELVRECEKQGQPYSVRVFKGAPGHDVCDEFERQSRDREKFRTALMELDEADAATLASWGQATPEDAGSQETTPEDAGEPPRPPRFKLHTLQQMGAMPRAEWLVRGLLVEKTASMFSGDSGTYKSLTALEMALCIATGHDFHGREVKQGTVVYVAAEGFYTAFERAQAWSQVRGVELPENLHFLEVPVNVAEPDTVQAFADQIAELSPVLVILDTLSQCATGLNENSNDEMARFMAGMMRLGRELGTHVMALHHNAKGTGAMRGAGAIKNNADAQISMEKPENAPPGDYTVFVRCEKQRGKPFEPFTLRGTEVELQGVVDEHGDPITSLVFEPCGDAVASSKHPNARRADKTRTALLQVLEDLETRQECADRGGVKVGEWLGAAEEARPPVCGSSSFFRYRKKLEAEGEIEECGEHNGSLLYRRTLTPTTPITPTKPYGSYGSCGPKPDATSTPTTPTTLKGGSCGSESADGVGVGVGEGAARTRKARNSADAEKGYASTRPRTEVQVLEEGSR